MADRAFLEAELISITRAITAVRRAIEIREQNGESTADLRATLEDYQGQLAAVQKQLSLLATQPPAASAGEITAQEQRARDQGAQVIAPGSPVGAPPVSTGPGVSNADQAQTIGDSNTNAPLRRATDTQSTPPITATPGGVPGRVGAAAPVSAPAIDPFEVDGTPAGAAQSAGRASAAAQGGVNDDARSNRPTGQAGAAAPNDNAANSSGSAGTSVTARINSLFGGEAGRIIPQGNALDAYASYTYTVSIYLLSDDDLKLMLKDKVLPKGWQLILQSGGAPVPGGRLRPIDRQEQQQAADGNGGVLPQPELGRNEFFELDLYIDDIVINHYAPNRGSYGPFATTDIAFKIYEPNGMSFLPNLYKAVQQYVNQTGGGWAGANQVYSAQNFLMVVRFYGYDANGNLVTAANTTNPIIGTDGQVVQPGQTATIEKYIPFQFSEINWRIQGKVTEYDCKAATPPNAILTGQARGTIPYNIELSGETVKDILTGPIALVTAPPERARSRDADAQPGGFYGPPKADAANKARKTTISQGLQEALNRYQQELVDEGKYQEYPDIYEIVIAEDVIANAKVVPPGEFNPRQSAMIQAQTAREVKDGATQSVDTNTKTLKAMAGKSIVQFIDEVMRQSTYVLEQQKFYIDSKTGALVEMANPNQVLAWYRIALEAEPTGQYDRIRQDKVYRLRYTIAAYRVDQIKSDYFPRTQFPGRHKVYDYWFTGENTQVLNFEQKLNNLWYLVQNAPAGPKVTSNYLEADRYFYAPLTSENSQGQENMRVYDGAASAASWLYSPGDQASVTLDIVGDPAWIWQGELWSGFPENLNINYAPFLRDGTINPSAGDIMFEIVFNQPVDYDLQTGLMDPGQFNYGTNTAARQAGNYGASGAGKARERYIYRARTCRSFLRQGRFVQQLVGDIVTFPLQDATPSEQDRRNEELVRREQAAAAQTQGRAPQRGVMPGRTYTPPVPSGSRGSLANRGATRPVAPPPGDTIQRNDFFPTPATGLENPVPQPAATAPTSSTQPVGQAASGLPGIATLGGAAGPAVGVPQIPVVLINTQQVDVTNEAEIRALLAAGQISQFSADVALRRLAQAREAANNPITNRSGQLMPREP